MRLLTKTHSKGGGGGGLFGRGRCFGGGRLFGRGRLFEGGRLIESYAVSPSDGPVTVKSSMPVKTVTGFSELCDFVDVTCAC